MRILTSRAAATRRTNFLLHRRGSAAVFLVSGLLCGNIAAQEEPSFRTGVNLVLLDVSVTDSKGVPVPDLRPENFEIKENGQVRELSGFDLGSAHASIALVVDFSASMKPRHDAVVASVRHFVSLLRPQDEAALFAFNENPTPLAERVMVASMDRPSWLAALEARRPTGQTALYDAVIRASRELNDAAHERRVMVILSDGEDTASSADLEDAMEVLQSSNRLLYAIGLFEPGEPDTDAGALRKLAESTGGLALFDDDTANLSSQLTRIMSDLRQRYLLSFHSDPPAEGETVVRKLSVTARDDESHKLKVKGRNRYRAVGRSAATGQ